MPDSPGDQEGRRGFFGSLWRVAALIGLGAVGGTLFARARQGLKDQTCTFESGCGGCDRLADCGLPQAMSARQVLGRK
jgi:hypothetical protein